MAIPSSTTTCGVSTASALTMFTTCLGISSRDKSKAWLGTTSLIFGQTFFGVCPDCQGGFAADCGGASR